MRSTFNTIVLVWFCNAGFLLLLSCDQHSTNRIRRTLILSEERLKTINELAQKEARVKMLRDEVLALAEAQLDQPLITYTDLYDRPHRTTPEALAGKYVLDIASLTSSRLILLSLASRLAPNDHQYFDRVIKELHAVLDLKDWNPGHFLDVGELSLGVALTYNWLYPSLPDPLRKHIENDLLRKAIEPGLAAYRDQKKWTTAFNNWTQVVNAGLLVSSLALSGRFPDKTSQLIGNIKEVLPKAMDYIYKDNGVYEEGPSYWQYGTTYNVILLDVLISGQHDDWGLLDKQGFQKTGDFLMHSVSPTYRYFNYADAPEEARFSPAMYWFADKYQRGDYEAYANSWIDHLLAAGEETGSPRFALSGSLEDRYTCRFLPFALIWYVQDLQGETDIPPGLVLKKEGVAMWRSAWKDENALFLGVKGGENGVSHSHLDLGSFVFEVDGVRWARDLGREVYNLPGMFDYEEQRWTYFRLGTSSHNTLMFDGQNQGPKGKAEIIEYSFEKGQGFVEINLTNAYDVDAGKILRRFDFDSTKLLISDKIEELKNVQEVRWAMLSDAEIQVEGNRATLNSHGKVLQARILKPTGTAFKVIPTKPATPDEKQNEGMDLLVCHIDPAAKELEIVIEFSVQ